MKNIFEILPGLEKIQLKIKDHNTQKVSPLIMADKNSVYIPEFYNLDKEESVRQIKEWSRIQAVSAIEEIEYNLYLDKFIFNISAMRDPYNCGLAHVFKIEFEGKPGMSFFNKLLKIIAYDMQKPILAFSTNSDNKNRTLVEKTFTKMEQTFVNYNWHDHEILFYVKQVLDSTPKNKFDNFTLLKLVRDDTKTIGKEFNRQPVSDSTAVEM